MFKVTTFQGWAIDAKGSRVGVYTGIGQVSGTDLFTNVIEGDRVAIQLGASRSFGHSNWVMVGLASVETDAHSFATALLNSPYCGDALAAAQNYDFGGLVFIINAHEGETKARLLGFVSDVAAILRRDSQWVLPQ